jgi:HD-like signal output (HDOD) protein
MDRILFVDDEPGVVAGLRRSLYRHRGEWEMMFADSPEAAIECLDTEHVDVVVTDMQMPRIDGAELLRRARDAQPGAARIVLTGHSHPAAAIRAVSVAHQVLSKPCEPEDLSRAIERACRVRRLLKSEQLRQAVGSVESLPSVPDVLQRLNECIERFANPREIADVLQHDGAIVGRVLQLVNSSFFGLGRRITDPAHAVAYLGVDVLRSVVASAACFRSVDAGVHIPGFSLERMHAHAFDTGRVCRAIPCHDRERSDALAASLLQDFGQVVLSVAIPEKFASVVERTTPDLPLHLVEQEELGFTHAEIGAYLLALWGLPDAVVEAVAEHHGDAPPRADEAHLDRSPLGVADLVRVARAFVRVSRQLADDPMDVPLAQLPTAWVDSLGPTTLERLATAIDSEVES